MLKYSGFTPTETFPKFDNFTKLFLWQIQNPAHNVDLITPVNYPSKQNIDYKSIGLFLKNILGFLKSFIIFLFFSKTFPEKYQKTKNCSGMDIPE